MNIARKARILALSAVLCAAGTSYGQAVYGSLYGTVTDASGAAVPNATVTVTDVAKGTSVTVTTNDSGTYTAEHLIPDVYTVKVESAGFSTFQTTGIQVSADTAPKVDAKLTVGAAGTTVEVTADSIPALKTDRADIATIFDQKNVSELPLPNRNFTGLQLLLPGAQALGWSHASSENPQGSQQIIINGQSFAGVGYELDGTDNQDPILGIIVVNPTVDSVAEAKITTQNYDAQFGKAVAAVITTQTKSGGNAIHGGLYDFRQSTANQAKNPFDRPDIVTGKVVPVGLRNQFGGYIGGPVVKDQIFYFLDYEGLRSKVGTSNGLLSVPTALLRSSCARLACDFSDYVNGRYTAGSTAAAGGRIYNAAGVAYAGNIIPATDLNQPAVKLLLGLPSPNNSATVANYSSQGTGRFNYDEGTARMDFQITPTTHGFGRFSQFQNTLQGATAFGALGGPGFGTGNFGGSSVGRNQSIAAGVDIVVSPKWLTDVRFGYFRYNIVTAKYDGQEAFATNNGIPGLNVSQFANTGGAPEFDFTGFPNDNNGDGGANFGSGLGTNRCNCPLTQNERGFQFVNNWTHELGNHSIKFGADVRHAYNLRVPSDSNRAGVLSFASAQSGTLSGQEGFSYASFVLGRVNQLSRYASTTSNASETQNRLFMYVQDTWKASPKLVVNYGLRWENYFPEKVGPNLGASLNLDTGNLQVAHSGPFGGDMGVSNAYKAFAPRIGVAYSYNNKTVIRAGYGRSFDIGVFGSIFGHNVTQNLPVLAKQQSNPSGGNAAVFTLGQQPCTVATTPNNTCLPIPNFGSAPVNGVIRLPDGIAANGRPTTERFPTIDAFNAEVQRDLGKQFSLTIGYVGNKGTHTFAGDSGNVDPNEIRETYNGLTFNPLMSNGQLALPGQPRSDAGDNRRRKFYSLYGWTQGLNYFSNGNDTHYNALQISLDKRFSQFYQFKVNFAYQKATNYAQNYVTVNKAVEYGNQDDLRQKALTVFGNLELPFGRGKAFLQNSKMADYVFGGLQISPTINLSSGLPYWPGYSACGNDRDNGPCTPNYTGSGFNQGLYRTIVNPGTTAATYTVTYYRKQVLGGTGSPFTQPNFGTFGNIQRNSFFGPYFFSGDMAAQKSFHVYEKYQVLFRTDAYNVFNHMAYSNPDTTVDGGNAGRITSLAPGLLPRRLQFAVQVKF